MTTLDQIKSLMKSGDIAGAEALCRKALEANPEDVSVRFLFATCRRLLGDAATFRDIMLDIAPKMEAIVRDDPDSDAARLWRKSGAALMEYVVLGVLVVAAAVGTVVWFGRQIQDRLEEMTKALAGYRGPPATILEVKPAGTNVLETATTNNVVPSSGALEQPSQTESETP